MPQNKKPLKKGDTVLLAVFLVALTALAVLYVNRALYYQKHFLPSTFINGVDYAELTPADYVENKQAAIQTYTLTVNARECEPEQITAADIDLKLKGDEEAVQALESQNAWLWIYQSFTTRNYQFADEVTFDNNKVDDKFKKLALVTNEQRKPKDATWTYDKKTHEYKVKKEDLGTTIERNNVYQAFVNAISSGEPELDITEDAQFYKQPTRFSSDTNLNKAIKKGNKLLSGTVTYTIHDGVVNVDADKIRKWVKLDIKKGKASLQQEKVEEFLKNLGAKHDTLSAPYKLKTRRGDTVTVSGFYGWKIDRDKELESLMKDIKAGKHVEREPKYSYRGEGGSDHPFGTTYAEVDLTNQRMYLVKGGKTKMSSDVVTGNVSHGSGTPTGIYRISYKDRDAVLRGPRLSNGKYSYESPVSYWMPFNQGIGFHDATWRSSFGGSIYRYDGSHGCVNMPYSKAKELFDYVYAGMVVIVYN